MATLAPEHNRGFTLIEILMAVSLLSMLMLTAMYSYSYMQQNWQRTKASEQKVLYHYQQWQLLSEILLNTFPKLVLFDTKSPSTNPERQAGFYFLGKDNGFTAVSATSMQDAASASVYRIIKEPDPTLLGRWQLVYEEALLSKVALVDASQDLPFNFRRILLTEQQSITFHYVGWASLQEKMQAENQELQGSIKPSEFSEYDGLQTLLQPEQVIVKSDLWQWQQVLTQSGLKQLSQLDTGI